MTRRLTQVVVVLVALLALAQFIRPAQSNPPTDPARSIHAQAGMSALSEVVGRSCGDCHSNATVWSSWYTQVAPLSWLMAHEVAEGRKAINFSEWAAYSPEQQRTLLRVSCDEARSGRMPGPYPWFKPETRLSAQDIETICAAARQSEPRATAASR